jgi:phosphoglycolate phosphatase-like HAD superfamily hydrolase
VCTHRYIGDSPSDGLAARAAGMTGVGVLWGANPRSRLDGYFDVLVTSVAELREALLRILTGGDTVSLDKSSA